MSHQAILTATPGQTVGPFYGYALPYPGDDELVPPGHRDAIRLHGTVYDGAGNPVPDALIEIWQADENGDVPRAEGSLLRDGWTFTGFGRAAVDGTGHYSFTTVRPGPTEDGAAPFFAVTVFARGLLNRLFTRAYLPDDEAALVRRHAAAVRARGPSRHPGRAPRRRRLRLRHPAAGRRRDRLPVLPGILMADLFWPGDERAELTLRPATLLGDAGRGRGGLAGGTRRRSRAGPATAEGRRCTVWSSRRDLDQVALRRRGERQPRRTPACRCCASDS